MSTRERILDSSERLFAENGFTGTSMRLITNEADVNVAAINYHFGTKEILIQAVFERFLDPLTKVLLDELSQLDAETNANLLTVDRVLETFVAAGVHINDRIPDGVIIFVRLLGHSFVEPQLGHLRVFLSEKYSDVIQAYKQAFAKVLPDLPEVELFWRLHYMLGALGFTLAGLDGLQKIAARDFQDELDMEHQIRRLLTFLSAGLQADSQSFSTLELKVI